MWAAEWEGPRRGGRRFPEQHADGKKVLGADLEIVGMPPGTAPDKDQDRMSNSESSSAWL
jgi:hypothetical protein